MALWGEYQSVLQLSVALNTAYAALATYVGNDLQVERQSIRELDGAVPPERRASKDTARAVADLQVLDGKIASAQIKYESAINSYFRPACLLGSFLGVALLIVSSVLYTSNIDGFWKIASCLLLSPFLLGTLYAAKLHLDVRRKYRKERRLIERTIWPAVDKG